MKIRNIVDGRMEWSMLEWNRERRRRGKKEE